MTHLDLMNRNVAHDLGDALRFGLEEGANPGRGALGDENDAGTANNAPHEVLFARVCHGLLGNHPAALNLGQCNLHGTRRILDLRVQCAAGKNAQQQEGCGERAHDADDKPANKRHVGQPGHQHEDGDHRSGRSEKHPRKCRVGAFGQSVCVEDVLIEAPLAGGIRFTHSLIIVRAIDDRKSTRPIRHFVK